MKKSSEAPRRHMQTDRSDAVAKKASEEPQHEMTFRRGRTLTGSASSAVRAVSESLADIKSNRVQGHELRRHRKHLGMAFSLVLVGTLLLASLIMQFTAGATLTARGVPASAFNSKKYEAIIQEYLTTRPSERLRFLQNTDQLQTFLQSKAPEVKSVTSGGWGGFGVSSYSLTFREPIAGWTIADKQQYVDDSGTAFSQNYFSTPSVQIIDHATIPSISGQIASNRFLTFVGLVSGSLKTHGLTVTQMTIPADTTRQLEVSVEGVGYAIKMSIDRSAGEQAEDAARAVAWFSSNGKTPKYIDVRVAGRAFYGE